MARWSPQWSHGIVVQYLKVKPSIICWMPAGCPPRLTPLVPMLVTSPFLLEMPRVTRKSNCTVKHYTAQGKLQADCNSRKRRTNSSRVRGIEVSFGDELIPQNLCGTFKVYKMILHPQSPLVCMTNSVKLVKYSPPFYICRNWGPEKVRDLPQAPLARTGLWIRSSDSK